MDFSPDCINVNHNYDIITKMSKVSVTCQECGKTFRVLQSQIKWQRGKYCSKKCLVKSCFGEKKPQLETQNKTDLSRVSKGV